MHAEASRASLPSDTNLLVDACVARIRELARLDDDAVLPPLPPVAPRRDVVIMVKSDVEAASLAAGGLAGSAPIERIIVSTSEIPSKRRRRSRWPLMLCGFIACAAASAAFLASPVAKRPRVARVTQSARSHATHAAHAAAQATASFFAQ